MRLGDAKAQKEAHALLRAWAQKGFGSHTLAKVPTKWGKCSKVWASERLPHCPCFKGRVLGLLA